MNAGSMQNQGCGGGKEMGWAHERKVFNRIKWAQVYVNARVFFFAFLFWACGLPGCRSKSIGKGYIKLNWLIKINNRNKW